jgi:hypothetical protein
MIAGKGAKFRVERNSFLGARELTIDVWKTAEELECKAFLGVFQDEIMDDHLSLQKVGIPAIDIIDFSYQHWHRLADTPDACAPDTMEQVARVVTVWMQRVK